jgi:hypothetical protein
MDIQINCWPFALFVFNLLYFMSLYFLVWPLYCRWWALLLLLITHSDTHTHSQTHVVTFTVFKNNSCTSFKHSFTSKFENTKIVKKCFVKTSLKPYMFRSLLYDHPQGLSFVLSALPLLRLFASSCCLFGMWQYVACVCVCVCVPDASSQQNLFDI